VWGLALRRLRERPFEGLPAATDTRERASRAQALPAILLYRELLTRVDPERALAVTTEVITRGAVQHLHKTLGDLDPEAFAALGDAERRARVEGWMDRFFTATAHVDRVDDEGVAFTVTACALARLSRAAGHPELAPAFCRGDAEFFRTRNPPVALERSQSIAEGADSCPFRLTLAATATRAEASDRRQPSPGASRSRSTE
jgi:hypothetical protein